MAQDFVFSNPIHRSGLISEIIRNNLDAIGSLNSGTAEPDDPEVGMPWLDTSSSPTTFYLKVYTAAGWLTIATYPTVTSYASFYRASVSVASASWSITHSLSVRPVAVHCFDSSYNKIEPLSVDTSNVNIAVIIHAAALTGHVLITG